MAIPKGKYPGFDKLTDFISQYIDEKCISKEYSIDIKEAKEKLKESKTEYYQYLNIYTILKDILLEHRFGLPDPLFETETEDDIYKIVFDIMSCVEAKNCLGISTNQNAPAIEGNLFGLSADDFNLKSSTKKSLHQSIQQVLLPQVEKKLKSLSLDLYSFFNPTNKDSEGLALAKANKLPHYIVTEQEKIDEAKKKIINEERHHQDVFRQHFNEISAKVNELENEYMDNTGLEEIEKNRVTTDWLMAKCDFILKKVKVMRNRIYFETYTKENIESLKKVREHLTKEIRDTKEEIQRTQNSLKVYETIGESFSNLLNQYTELNEAIENKKWALAELKSSKVN